MPFVIPRITVPGQHTGTVTEIIKGNSDPEDGDLEEYICFLKLELQRAVHSLGVTADPEDEQ